MLKKAEILRDKLNLDKKTGSRKAKFDNIENSTTNLENKAESITTNLDNIIENDTTNLDNTTENSTTNLDGATENDTTNLDNTAESNTAKFDDSIESSTSNLDSTTENGTAQLENITESVTTKLDNITESNITKLDNTAENDETKIAEKFLIFSILGKLYSLPSRFIGEIALFDNVYPLPLMPSYVPGVVNRYSVPYALFDIGLLFYSTPSPRSKVLVMKDEIDRIAFLIDDVSGIADVPQEDILNMERGSEMSNKVGLDDITDAVESSFRWNGSDVLVLDIRRILDKAAGDAV